MKCESVSVHAGFLQAMQAWVWHRNPTRQLSAADVYYALQWASSGVPAHDFTQAFDACLEAHPEYMADGCRLSKMRYAALRVIASSRRTAPQPAAIPVPVNAQDPYGITLDRVIECGKQTENDLLKDILREAFQALRLAHRAAIARHPEWRQTPENFYRYKAQYVYDYEKIVSNIMTSAQNIITDDERKQLSQLTRAQQIHCFRLGDSAKEKYIEKIYINNLAQYLGFSKLLEIV